MYDYERVIFVVGLFFMVGVTWVILMGGVND